MQILNEDYETDLEDLISSFDKHANPRRRIEEYHDVRRLRNALKDFDAPDPRRKRRRKH